MYSTALEYYQFNYDLWMHHILLEKELDPDLTATSTAKRIEKAALNGVNLWVPNIIS
ncbi:hypothetical protein SAMD00019534_076860 [Acytostelium subglobosum LB1]|uniref:hypothetical protein n=1 Tax=Acytostelium subglobosum LB1 TaxID=1410327 RepID=UPI0006448B88|nr:hypothetical protein SAMD00019534_076860 [Acytostelium subglobosum LB1]GAM24511.1 hypothetical protein SAMD00019534_076860 [Acytostelium subglobosum LB1]|eukprot:XP_012752837.1 hypothetical protein SAMD00019534_076860 [Acytostelium subglobosum LB1]